MNAIRAWMERELVKRYYGNTVLYSANVEGMRRIRNAQRTYTGADIDSDLRKAYERDQYSTLDDYPLDRTLFESIRSKAITALDDPNLSPCAWMSGEQAARAGVPRDAIPHDVRRYTKNVAAIIPEAPLLLNDRLVHAIQSSIGSNFFLEDIFLTRNYHVAQDLRARFELLSDRWHFDDQYTDGFSLFVCLSDVTEQDGPFHVINKVDSKRLVRHGFDSSVRKQSFTGGLKDTAVDEMPSFKRLVGKAGSKMLCHTSFCLHRAGVPEAGHTRNMMIMTFRPSPNLSLVWPRPVH